MVTPGVPVSLRGTLSHLHTDTHTHTNANTYPHMHTSTHIAAHKRTLGEFGPAGIKCHCCREGTLKQARVRTNRKARRASRQSLHSLTEGLAFIEAMEDAEIAYHHGNAALTAEDVAAHVAAIEG